MGAHADKNLHESLDKIIDELNKTADAGIKFTPSMIREVTSTLAIVRDCHKQLAEFEQIIDGSDGKIVPIHSRLNWRTA